MLLLLLLMQLVMKMLGEVTESPIMQAPPATRLR